STKSISTTGDIVANLNNTTGTVSLGSATTKTGNVTIAVNGATNSVNTGDLQATAGSVVVNAEGSNGAITVGNVTAASASITSGSGSTTIGTVAAGSVAIDLSSTLGDVTVGKITSDNVLFNGAKLKDNGTAGTITIDASTGANFVATVNGGLGKDALTVKGSATTKTIKIAGDLGLGGTTPADQKLTLDLDASTKLSSLDISGLKGLGAATAIDLKNVVVDNKLIVDIKGNDAAETITVATPTATLTEIKLSGDLDGGENTYDITPVDSAIALKNIDLSGLSATGGTLEGTITLDSTHTKVSSIKGSAGKDTVDMSALLAATGKVAIDLGAGDDEILIGKLQEGNAKQITITGGEGNDTFNLTAAVVSAAAKADFTTITDFSAGDTIKLAAATTKYVNTAITQPNGTLQEVIVAMLSAANGGNGGEVKTVYGFTWNTDNYLFYNTTANGKAIASTDVLVKLAGTTVDLDSLTVINNDIVFTS
ncbi:beta strand repeat-containing protein, partial [Campylobacter fetus]|uniref:beta strand repeat-containing protein n=2 Tax=Campylobacter TaxID=194 RepID=UPI003B75D258